MSSYEIAEVSYAAFGLFLGGFFTLLGLWVASVCFPHSEKH